MKSYLALGLLLLDMSCIRPTDTAAIQSNPSMPEKELTDSSTTVLVCPTPGVLFKTTGGLQICMDPKEMWMQKALDILKKRFQQG
ncbi:C-C motif chemokine 18-like isoform X3 [Heterodontus francisci]|uniref:C-C motif chemokine 18-like isoform X3 n=1 Tax=Heterodontus francisci TaxID=7792 RepID=UPI00355BDACC